MFEILLTIFFIVLLLCIFDALEHISIGSTVHRWVMAACVSALSIISLIRFIKPGDSVPQDTDTADQWISILLLPYAALAVAIVVILFFLLVRRCFHRKEKRIPKKNRRPSGEFKQKRMLRDSHRMFKDKE